MGLLVTQMPSRPQHTFIFIHPLQARMPALTFVIPHLLCEALVWLVTKEDIERF